MMFVLKIPIVALFWIVWRAIHATPETEAETGPGGGGPPQPRPVRPRSPRRGDHAEIALPPPARVRAVAGKRPKVR